MIVYDLKCSAAHVFEAWFGDPADFEAQRGRDLVACPLCGDTGVERVPTAPAIGGKSGQGVPDGAPSDAEKAKRTLAAMADAQAKAVAGSEYVGGRFAEEARAMHHGEASHRSIYGEAKASEAKELREEGIAAMPLLFPVRPRGHDA